MTNHYQLKTAHITLDKADGAAKQLLEEANQSLGFVPNMYQGMAIAPGMLSTYLHGYDQFRQHSGFKPDEQEVIFLTISRFHDCKYCMSAHSMIGENMSGLDKNVLAAIREGREIPDSRLQALASFTKTLVESRGLPSKEEVEAFINTGFTEPQILQIILAIAVKTLSNYSNHLTKPEVDSAFASHVWPEN